MTRFKSIFPLLVFTLLSGCSEGPGDLKGTWKMSGAMPVTVTYRDGEEESMGIISNVKYKHEGNDVLVTYMDGFAKGTTMRITITGQRTAVTGIVKLTRIK